MISVAAELVGMHPQTLRIYEKKGLVRPQRTAGNTRLYSEADLERLRLIQRLTTELGLNLAGVETRAPPRGRAAAAAARARARSSARCARRSQHVHRQYRRDLVLYRDPTDAPRTHEEDDGLQQADDQVAGGGRAPRRSWRAARGNPEIYPEHLLLALLDQELPRTLVDAPEPRRRLRAQAEAALSREAVRPGRGAAAAASRPRSRRVLDKAEEEMRRLEDEYVSTEHLLLALDVVPRDELARGAQARCAAAQRVTLAGSGGHLPGAREVRPRPDRARRGGQARPGDRPRRGDPPRDPGALAPHEEQPGPDRRARASARPRSSRASPSASSPATCPRA